MMTLMIVFDPEYCDIGKGEDDNTPLLFRGNGIRTCSPFFIERANVFPACRLYNDNEKAVAGYKLTNVRLQFE